MFLKDEPVDLDYVIKCLRADGSTLAGDEYLKASEVTEMGEFLIELANNLEKYGIK